MEVQTAKADLIVAVRAMCESALMFRGNHANLSSRLTDDTMLFTRGSRVESLTDDTFAVIRTTDGTVLEGKVMPRQAEIIDMHAAIYRHRQSVGSVIHAHAPHATAFAVAHEPIPVVYESLARRGMSEPTPIIPWAPRGSKASVERIVNVVQEKPGVAALLMANHGVLAFSQTPEAAVELLIALDECAELVLNARLLGGEKALPPTAFDDIQKRMKAFSSPQ